MLIVAWQSMLKSFEIYFLLCVLYRHHLSNTKWTFANPYNRDAAIAASLEWMRGGSGIPTLFGRDRNGRPDPKQSEGAAPKSYI